MKAWRWINQLKGAILFRFTNYLLVGLMGIWVAQVFSDLTAKFMRGDYQDMGLVFLQILLVAAISCLVIPVLQYQEANLMEKQGGEADIVFFREFLKQSNPEISEKDSGLYINILWGDFPTYRMNLIFLVSFFMAGIIALAVSMGITAWYSPEFAGLSLLTSTAAVLVPLLFQKRLEKRNEDRLEKKDETVERMKHVFANAEYIRLERHKGIAQCLLKPIQEKYADACIGYDRLQAALAYGITAVMLLIEISIYALGCYLISRGNMDFAVFVKVILLVGVTKNGIHWIVEGVGCIHDIRNSKKRIEKVTLPGTNAENQSLEEIHDIVIDGVSYTYPETDKTIIYPSASLETHNIYHIKGQNGAGKTTLLKILMKYYPDYEGNILVDGKNLREIRREDWYGLVSYIPQKPVLFHLSVRDNILLGNKNVDNELYEKLLKDFRLKELENKMVGFGGEGISGGEAQSISIVRTLLRKPGVVLADEPYNTLDQERRRIFSQYMNSMEDTLFLVVSHQELLEDKGRVKSFTLA